MCWYCYWGWPKVVAEIYDKYEPLAGSAMRDGPGHAVWSDCNFNDECIEGRIGDCDDRSYLGRFPKKTIDLVRASLVELLAVPEEIRDCAPDDFDIDLSEYPPPKGLEFVPAR